MSITAVANTPTADDDKLDMLRIEIRHWRKDKGLPFRFMPASMWNEAIGLARRLTVRRVACVLGLNLEELTRRMEGRQSPGAHTTVAAPAEADNPGVLAPRVCDLPRDALTPPDAASACASVTERAQAAPEGEQTTARPEPAVAPAPEAPRAAGAFEEAVLEVAATDGTRLTLRIPVGAFNSVNVSSLIHSFRSPA
jgi:hypothetical protein